MELHAGVKPAHSVWKTDMLIININEAWWQEWGMIPHTSGYEPAKRPIAFHPAT